MPELLTRVVVYLPLLLLALSVHEAAHAGAARLTGDRTAERLGRLTLFPWAHVDLVGSLLLPAALLVLRAPFLIGYAKPAPVDPGQLRNPKRDLSLVALAGPASNLALALLLAAIGWLFYGYLGLDNSAGRLLIGAGIVLNLVLANLNMLPLPGFDGMKALYAVLPDSWCWQLQRSERYFLVVLVLVAWTQALDLALVPAWWASQQLCSMAGVGLPAL